MNKAGLILLNYNQADETINCVKQLLSFELNIKIIVVDNKSPDGSYKKLSDDLQDIENVDLIQNSYNGGYGAGNNLGIKYAIKKYDIETIGIINPDVFLPRKEILTDLIYELYSEDKFSVIGASAIDGSGNYNSNYSSWNLPTNKELIWNQCIFNKRYKKQQEYRMINDRLAEVDCVAGCFFLIKTERFKEVGFFDENVFMYNEENILGIKLKKAGYQEVLALNHFYYHNHRPRKEERSGLLYKIKKGGTSFRSRCYLCKNFYSEKLLPALYVIEIVNIAYAAIQYIKKIKDYIFRKMIYITKIRKRK